MSAASSKTVSGVNDAKLVPLGQEALAERCASEIAKLVPLVQEALADGKLDVNEILQLAILVAQNVNAFQDLSGPQKKYCVLHVIQQAFEAAVPVEQREQVGYTIALQVLPTVLDIAVAAARGKLDLKRVSTSCLAGCFGGLWDLFAKHSAANVVPPVPLPELAPPSTATLESVVPPKDMFPLKESPKEPSHQASVEVAPQENRCSEDVSIQFPNTAILESVPEE